MRIGVRPPFFEKVQIPNPLRTPASLPWTCLGCNGEPQSLWLAAGEDVRLTVEDDDLSASGEIKVGGCCADRGAGRQEGVSYAFR